MDKAQALQETIRKTIPLSDFMGLEILELSDTAIKVKADGEANINIHGTAFAGSLYTTATLCAWALIHSRLPADTMLVLANAEVKYRKPVLGDLYASAEVDEKDFADLLQRLEERGKANLEVDVFIPNADAPALVYKARYHCRPN